MATAEFGDRVRQGTGAPDVAGEDHVLKWDVFVWLLFVGVKGERRGRWEFEGVLPSFVEAWMHMSLDLSIRHVCHMYTPRITFMPGNLLSGPVAHTGTPGKMGPTVMARFTPSPMLSG